MRRFSMFQRTDNTLSVRISERKHLCVRYPQPLLLDSAPNRGARNKLVFTHVDALKEFATLGIVRR
jgi:hypothetical protein